MQAKTAQAPVKHFLVPEHFLLSKGQAAQLLTKYNLVLEQLPKISVSDPAIADLKPQKNDIVKIVRDSPTAGKTVYYRKVG